MVKSLTIGLVDDGVATWNPVSDGNLLVTGGAGCGKTWWLTHTLIPGLNEMGQRVYMFDGYVDRGYTKPVQGVIPVNDPTSILEEPDSFLIIDHVNPGLEQLRSQSPPSRKGIATAIVQTNQRILANLPEASWRMTPQTLLRNPSKPYLYHGILSIQTTDTATR